MTARRFDKLMLALAMAAIFLGLYPIFEHPFGLPQTFLLFFGLHSYALILTLALVMTRFYAARVRTGRALEELQRRRDSLVKALCEGYHTMAHEKRNLMNQPGFAPRDLSVPDTVKVLEKYCDTIKEILEAMFWRLGLKFHETVKALTRSEDKRSLLAVAVARDSSSARSFGAKIDNRQRHPIEQNTAIQILLDVLQRVFACDDLLSHRGYSNTSSCWSKRYTATMVVPIRKNGISLDNSFELVGYIGVDCMPTDGSNVFCNDSGDPKDCLTALLLGFADSAYGILKRGKIVEKPENMVRQYVVDYDNFEFIEKLNTWFANHAS